MTWLIFIAKKMFGSSRPEDFCKKVFIAISQNSQETPVPEPLFNKVAVLRSGTLFEKETLTQVLPCEFCKISKGKYTL